MYKLLRLQFVTAFIAALPFMASSQSMGINTDGSTANASAILDVKSSAKGILIPRMSRTERNAIGTPATGLMIFQSTPDSIGLYYYNGSAWTWVLANSNADSLAWRTGGNTGTNDASNFIGTKDNIPFNIRVNNQKAGRIDNSLANTFFGYQAGNSISTGFNNIANGSQALFNNSTGFNNTAIGWSALYSNSTGGQNTANGSSTLYNNTIGQQNTANGVSALYSNTTGNLNTANGYQSLFNNTTGSNNIANGNFTLYSNTTGGNNTAIGLQALITNTTGSNNTALGGAANVTSGALTNATAVGYAATVNTSNKIRLGNATVTIIEGQVAYTFPSDGRFKTNIRESDVKGLDFIKRLRPVVYNFDTRKYEEFITKNMVDSIRQKYLKDDFAASTSIRQSGFIAQEVEKAALESGYNFNGVHKPDNENDHYSLAYSQFVVPLVKAIQEQQQMIEKQQQVNINQQQMIEKQQLQIDELKKLIEQLVKGKNQ